MIVQVGRAKLQIGELNKQLAGTLAKLPEPTDPWRSDPEWPGLARLGFLVVVLAAMVVYAVLSHASEARFRVAGEGGERSQISLGQRNRQDQGKEKRDNYQDHRQ